MFHIFSYIKDQIWDTLSLTSGTDVDGTIKTIQKGVELRGANMWILVCSALLASIGLDVNSSAVIIGAMLISPLMSPILGIGLGVGISDREMIISSARNFGIAVALSLFASIIYFILTPLGQTTPEMAARTQPTLLDVGVAVFGGVAGIVANSRREATNAIPGVAIATALMPPLCTAGYGIASGQMAFFLGAFYLFFINAVFISLSTYIVTRLLKFPTKEFIDNQLKKKIQTWIGVFALAVIIPSTFIFWDVIQDARLQRKVGIFMQEKLSSEKYEAIKWIRTETDTTEILKIYVIGEPINKKEIQGITKTMSQYDLEDYTLKLVQMNVPEEERTKIKTEVAGEVASNVLKQIELTKEVQSAKDKTIDSLLQVIAGMQFSGSFIEQVRGEVEVLFPEIESLNFGLLSPGAQDTTEFRLPVVIAEIGTRMRSSERAELKDKFTEFLKKRMRTDTLNVVLN